MTKKEIKALVASKIAGQGTMVDLGGALPTILDAIVDALPEGGASPTAPEPAITFNANSLAGATIEEAATTFGISVEELISIPKQLVIETASGVVLTRTTLNESGGTVAVEFGNQNTYFTMTITDDNRVNADAEIN